MLDKLKYFIDNFRKKTKLLKLKLEEINSKLNNIFSKLNILNKYYKYFFIFSSIILYLLFKIFFQTGMGGDDSRFYMFYPTKFYEVFTDKSP